MRPFRDSEGADRPVWVDFERSNYEDGNPNASGTRDRAIFNINVGTMARGGDCSWDTRAGVACGSTGATARIGHYVRKTRHFVALLCR